MNEWMEPFISQCLADIPQGKYRRRMSAELRDHMAALRQDLTEAEVLEHMGDPERLRKEYYVAWKQTPLCRANWLASGIIVIWSLLFACLLLLEGFDEWFGLARGPALAAFFLSSFPLGALYLRACFREERHRGWWVTLGLLAAWASFNLYLTWGCMAIEAFDKYPERLHGHSPLVAMLERNPWMIPHLCLTFVGCLALGWLFGRKTERRHESA